MIPSNNIRNKTKADQEMCCTVRRSIFCRWQTKNIKWTKLTVVSVTFVLNCTEKKKIASLFFLYFHTPPKNHKPHEMSGYVIK